MVRKGWEEAAHPMIEIEGLAGGRSILCVL